MSQQQYQSQRFQPPELYSISRGIVSRIESYGCFVKLHNSPVSGLVHISQLYSTKIDNVEDVVSLDMEVWIKVMDVQVETIEDETTGRTRQRHKIKLSMKYVNQDTGQDLDPENENLENDMQCSSRGGGGGGMSAGNAMDGTSGANSQLGQALSSNIGMSGIAMDPGNLVLKGKRGAASAINGYSLVGEDEGELDKPVPIINNNIAKNQESMMPVEQKAVMPMGRGRGTTLPAWMTRVEEDKLGSMSALPSAEDDSSRDSDRHRSKSRRDKHHRRERSSKKHRKKHKSRKHKDHRSRGGRSRSHSYSSYSSAGRSRSRSTERRSSKSHHKKKKSHKHHKRRRHRSDSRSRSRSRDSREEQTSEFTNIDEARAIMQRLEERRMETGSSINR